VWFTGLATVGLVVATGTLAAAAWKALEQLKVARRQLEDVKRDREVQVFSDLGLRWEGRAMTEALQLELEYSAEELRDLFRTASKKRSHNPLRERKRIREAQLRVVLLRVPNYFEDAAFIAKAGGLDIEGELFADAFGGVAVDEWKKWRLVVELLQEEDPLAYCEFQRLANEAKKDEPKKAGD
jgi:hypothetical protein